MRKSDLRGKSFVGRRCLRIGTPAPARRAADRGDRSHKTHTGRKALLPARIELPGATQGAVEWALAKTPPDGLEQLE